MRRQEGDLDARRRLPELEVADNRKYSLDTRVNGY
jgi:hypothetical protein